MKTCLLEKVLVSAGFILIHDGQRNPGQLELPPAEVTFFTRKYRWKVDGEFVSTWATFKYDSRSELADFEIYSREPESKGREKMIMNATDDEVLKVKEEVAVK